MSQNLLRLELEIIENQTQDYFSKFENVNGLVVDAIDNLKNKVLKNIKLWRNNLTVLEKS